MKEKIKTFYTERKAEVHAGLYGVLLGFVLGGLLI